MNNIVVQPEVIKALVDCIVDVIQNKIGWDSIDWQAVAEKTVERPQGEWLKFDDGSVACPICGTGTSIKSIPSVISFRYCPYCGAKMMKGGAE